MNKIEAFQAAAQRYTEKYTTSPKVALAVLVREGINNPDGTLTENYGGDYTASVADCQAFVDSILAPPS